MDNFDKTRDIIIGALACEAEAVTVEARIIEDLGADSLAMVELVMALEDAFGISVPEEQVAEIKTVGDILTMLAAKA